MNRNLFEQEIHIRILRILSADGEVTQRDLASRLGISLGKTNYCLTEIAAKGLVRIKRFKNSNNKMAYAYLLTTKGIEEKAKLTKSFLSLKVREYEALKREIAELSREVGSEIPAEASI